MSTDSACSKNSTSKPKVDFQINSAKPEFWRSLEQLADTDEVRDYLYREFPSGASEFSDGVARRNFLKIMGASIGLAGLAACSRQPAEHIIPYVKQAAEVKPGVPTYYATAITSGGYAIGLLAESHTGRPTKVEGNPKHPASLGATDAFAQASVLSLYDPDRSTVVTKDGVISTWGVFTASMDVLLNGAKDAAGVKISDGLRDHGGAGIRILTQTVTSPTLAAQLRGILTDMPGARWHQYEPVSRDNVRAGSLQAFGQAVETLYRLDLADIVLSLDADFLSSGPASLRMARDFAVKRHVTGPEAAAHMNRLYVIESTPTTTGATADHAVHVRPSQIETLARAIARKVGVSAPGPDADSAHQPLVDAVAADLQAHKGKCAVIPGDSQPPTVHALAHALNDALGNVGNTVVYTDPVEAEPVNQGESLRALVRDMQAGNVKLLIILGGNPVYDAPVDLEFAAAMNSVPTRVRLSMHSDETSEHCHWHIPETHYLEAWSDARAFDGTVSIVQPLILPLYSGKSAHELVALVAGKPGPSLEIVTNYWKGVLGATGFDVAWKTALARGFIDGSAYVPKTVAVRANAVGDAPSAPAAGVEISFRPDPTIGDGRWANNGWLQELPKPLTKITWDNAVLVGPAFARANSIDKFDVVEISLDGRTVQGQVWVQPGHPDGTVTLHLGYGRSKAGRVGNGTGFNAYQIRSADAPWIAAGAQIRRIGSGTELARTELHQVMTEEGRPIVRMGTAQEYEHNKDFVKHVPNAHEMPEEYNLLHGYAPDEAPWEGAKWGMVIDLNKCTGCGTCIVACQAENNIPVVGKDQVIKQREMHWIRVDRYYKGDPDGEPIVVHQPLPCQQCENAPCEVVCPVGATMHSKEGLNDMVYNRCVGTRYCSNNCPYKVRRFNFFDYTDLKTPATQLVYNPDVTVRTRGVMEKCTYCVQRINLARIEAKKEGRRIRDGEVITACQAVCPAGAIVFGDLNDPDSKVTAGAHDLRNYSLLSELNTKPRTTYLAKLRNPNPALEAPTTHSSEQHGDHH